MNRIRFKASHLMSLGLAVIADVAVLSATRWPLKTALFPAVIGTSVFFMALTELLLSLFEREEKEKKQSSIDFKLSEDVEKTVALRRTLLTFGWIFSFFFFILFFGFTIAIPLFVFLYMRLYGKEKWVISITMAATCFFFFWALFIWLLDTPIEEGLILRAIGIGG